MNYDQWKTTNPADEELGNKEQPSTACTDCDAPATRQWDLGDQHAFWMGYRFEPVCDACYQDRDNWEPADPDYTGTSAQETYFKAYRQKYHETQ